MDKPKAEWRTLNPDGSVAAEGSDEDVSRIAPIEGGTLRFTVELPLTRENAATIALMGMTPHIDRVREHRLRRHAREGR